MRRVFKYELGFPDTDLDLPLGAVLLHVAPQNGVPCLWALVDPEAPKAKCCFAIVGTGHAVPREAAYVGSWQEPPFVWHCFELTSKTFTGRPPPGGSGR